MAQVQDDIEQALPFMPTREEVQAAIVACWSPSPAVERVEVGDGLGRVLATGVRATYDCPPAQTAALDGIGVRFADVADGGADTSGWVRGRDYAITDTGDDVPDDFDTVIPVEGLLFTDADGASFAGEKGAAPFDEGFAIGEVTSLVNLGIPGINSLLLSGILYFVVMKTMSSLRGVKVLKFEETDQVL